jgi:hypothetical protein
VGHIVLDDYLGFKSIGLDIHGVSRIRRRLGRVVCIGSLVPGRAVAGVSFGRLHHDTIAEFGKNRLKTLKEVTYVDPTWAHANSESVTASDAMKYLHLAANAHLAQTLLNTVSSCS